MVINEIIIKKANSFLNQKEIKGNKGFIDKKFEEYMETVGWISGEAWCVYFVELVWWSAYAEYNSFIIPKLKLLFSGSAVQTLINFKKDKTFKISDEPEKGSIVIYQTYNDLKPHWSGHAGIVVDFNKTDVFLIEGNTNKIGSREGDGAYFKKRSLSSEIKNGLVNKGFIYPIT